MALPVAHARPLTSIIADAKLSVVAIGTFSALQSPRFTFSGTGFAFSDGSLIATCFHVIPEIREGAVRVELVVQRLNGNGEVETRPVEVLRVDKARDLAVLRLQGPAIPSLKLAAEDDREAMDGSPVALIGFPIGGLLGFSPVTHRGIVSSRIQNVAPPPTARQLTERAIASSRDGPFEVLQLDATAYPGNSGGPLLNAETGNVIGVVSMVLVKGTRESALSNPSGISYAVPVRYLAALADRK